MNIKFSDIIIVGAGLSGLYTALNLPSSLSVELLSAYEDNSSLAQGGVASCIEPGDTFHKHITDTLKAGHYINDLPAVAHLVSGGPEQIRQLIELGVRFDTNQEGDLATTLEGGHTNRRILHIQGDQTGKGIMDTLRGQLDLHKHIESTNQCHLLSLITEDNVVKGVIYMEDQCIYHHYANDVVLATGGLGDLYQQTTNHKGAIGTGIAIAHEAGAKCANMHYIQFHPTAFYEPDEGHRFLITEALRGEGAHLLDENGQRFMPDYDSRLELAPRDVVSKAIHNVLSKQSKPYVYLDTRHLHDDFLNQRFPGIAQYLLKHHITIGKDLIPVTPVAHYTIGGIVVDQQGRTSLDHLYACGEVTSSGVHGANRLASNSLLECLVYGKAIADVLSKTPPSTDTLSQVSELSDYQHMIMDSLDQGTIAIVQKLMTEQVGILRSTEGLIATRNHFKSLLEHNKAKRHERWSAFYNYSMLYTSILVLDDAIENPSLGCHTIEEPANND